MTTQYTPTVIDVCRRHGVWVCYVVKHHVAYEVYRGTDLDSCREYASRIGRGDGIVIGTPSVPWMD